MKFLLDQDVYATTAQFLTSLGHKELERVLKTYTENELMKAFVVVEPGRHRFRKRERP